VADVARSEQRALVTENVKDFARELDMVAVCVDFDGALRPSSPRGVRSRRVGVIGLLNVGELRSRQCRTGRAPGRGTPPVLGWFELDGRGSLRPRGRGEWGCGKEAVISGSVLFRHSRSLVAVLLVIAALTAVALDRLGAEADRHRQAVLGLTRLQVVTKSLEVAQERLATADPPPMQALTAETRALIDRADAELDRLERLGAARSGAVVREHLEVYRLGIEDELGLGAAGKRSEARALDETVVEPRFDSFEAHLDEQADQWAARAEQVERTRRAGSTTALMLAAGLVAAAVLRFVHAQERVRHLEEQRQRLAHRAAHDSLTGLANRERFNSLVDGALRAGDRPAVAFIDLDGFKQINDRFGHAAGDVVLQVAAERIRSVVRDEDVPARLGGDEFAVLLSTVPRAGAAPAVAERLRARLAEPISLEGRTVVVGASVGLAFGTAGDDAEALLRRADTAMYAAKHAGKGRLMIDAGDRALA
jgi:diguanylate cyclase (GGDEF)-like protein